MLDARVFRTASNPVGGSRHTFDHELARPVGTLFCLDFADERNDVPVGAIAPGSVFGNLGDPGAPDLVAGPNAGSLNLYDGSGIIQSSTTVTPVQSLFLGGAGLYNREFDMHLHAVLTLPNDAGNAAFSNSVLMRCGSAANNCLFNVDLGANGRAPSARLKSKASAPTLNGTFTGFQLGVAQIIDMVTVGAAGYLFVGGTQVAGPIPLGGIPDLSAAVMTILGGRGGAKLHRVMLQDLSQVTLYEALLGRTFTFADAVQEAFAASSAHTYA